MTFTPLLRRIREGKTNYRKRKGILIGKQLFATVRISNENSLVQILEARKNGDKALVSAHSKELIRHGWKGSRKNMPACYLTGFLAGRKALAKGVKECVLYTGNRMFAARVASCVKGIIDAGLNIPVDNETLPVEDRLTGKHIADYANDLKAKDNQVYRARFSALVKRGFNPESYPEHFEDIKSSILGKPVSKKLVVKKVEAKKKIVKSVAKLEKKRKKVAKLSETKPRVTTKKGAKKS
ncbi:MAG: 50S ribosomal protein L18 [Nitrososphaerales archaeon]